LDGDMKVITNKPPVYLILGIYGKISYSEKSLILRIISNEKEVIIYPDAQPL